LQRSRESRMTIKSKYAVAIANPFVWPYVRRGAERMLNDMAAYLKNRGYAVCVYAMAPQREKEERDGITYFLTKERFKSGKRQFNSCHYFAFALQKILREKPLDIVHCLSYFDAYAAIKARERFRLDYKVVFQSGGIPVRQYFRAVPIDWFFFRKVIRKADAVLVVSRFAQEKLKQDFSCESEVMPPPVAVESFWRKGPDTEPNPAEPKILFVGDVTEHRKGAQVLCKAFAEVKKVYSKATLHLSGKINQTVISNLLKEKDIRSAADDIHFLGLGTVGQLPSLYRSASVTVLPAVWEAFGLVLVESLAAGTPIVGVNHGGIPDIISDRAVGSLFEPAPFQEQTLNVKGLTRAILKTLQTVQTKEQIRRTQKLCGRHADKFSWSALGPSYENLYQRLMN